MDTDVVVLGTGAAGLVAALAAAEQGASVALFEKGDVVGGTTALSGGLCWVPVNPHMRAAGIADSREDALAYLDSLSLGMIDPTLAAALVDTGPEVVAWLEANTPVRFEVVRGYPDYHPEHPGGKPGGGRSLDPGLYCFQDLGPWADRVARPARNPYLTLTETPLGGGDGTVAPEVLADRTARDVRGCGQALVGALLARLPGPGHRTGPGGPRRRARRRRTVVSQAWPSTAPMARSASGPAAAWCWPPVASSGTSSWSAPSCAAR